MAMSASPGRWGGPRPPTASTRAAGLRWRRAPSMQDLLDEARRLLPDAIQLRRSIHAEPELGLDLPLTQAKVLAGLKDLPLSIRTGQRTTSVVADLRGGD